jgi:hypothetical protein
LVDRRAVRAALKGSTDEISWIFRIPKTFLLLQVFGGSLSRRLQLVFEDGG